MGSLKLSEVLDQQSVELVTSVLKGDQVTGGDNYRPFRQIGNSVLLGNSSGVHHAFGVVVKYNAEVKRLTAKPLFSYCDARLSLRTMQYISEAEFLVPSSATHLFASCNFVTLPSDRVYVAFAARIYLMQWAGKATGVPGVSGLPGEDAVMQQYRILKAYSMQTPGVHYDFMGSLRQDPVTKAIHCDLVFGHCLHAKGLKSMQRLNNADLFVSNSFTHLFKSCDFMGQGPKDYYLVYGNTLARISWG